VTHVRQDFREADEATEASEARWMRALGAGGPEAEAAFTSLHAVYGKLFVRRLRRLGLEPDDAQDAAQEVWLDVIRAAPKWRGDVPVRVYLRGFLRIAQLRWSSNRKDAPAFETFVEPDDVDGRVATMVPALSSGTPDEWSDFVRCVERALARLEHVQPRLVQLLLLHHVAEASLEEIVEVLGGDAKLAKSQLFSARRRAEPDLLPCLDLWPNRSVRTS
jgi:DNA-directed RNA polymerase specialized sigma24 family protein